MARHSPCIGVCKLDDAAGYCLGCGRTSTEIGDWMAMSEGQRDAVWQKLPERLSLVSARVRLLPWTREELIAWVCDTIVARQGTWVVGVPGAAAEFPTSDGAAINVHAEAGVINARRPDAVFRLAITEKIRAFALADVDVVVLGLPRGRASIETASSLQFVGTDKGAIADAHRGDPLFDLGIGRRYSRFCVRTRDDDLISLLRSHSGFHWSEFMPIIEARLSAASATRVTESAGARIEVTAKIPSPGQSSPNGAQTHFLPEFLKSGEEIAASLAPPDYAAPIAIFYSNKP